MIVCLFIFILILIAQQQQANIIGTLANICICAHISIACLERQVAA